MATAAITQALLAACSGLLDLPHLQTVDMLPAYERQNISRIAPPLETMRPLSTASMPTPP